MPVEGIPDRSKHRLCWRCQKWFMPHEGVIDFLPVRGPISFILDRTRRALEDDSRQRFFCDACHRDTIAEKDRGRNSMRIALIVSAAVLLAIMVAWYLGAFDGLLSRR